MFNTEHACILKQEMSSCCKLMLIVNKIKDSSKKVTVERSGHGNCKNNNPEAVGISPGDLLWRVTCVSEQILLEVKGVSKVFRSPGFGI